MKRTFTALLLVCALVCTMTGCRRNKDTANDSTAPSPSVTPSQSVEDDRNDALNGGGAGGTNNSKPDNSWTDDDPNGTLTPDPEITGGGLMDDVGDAVGDVGNAAGDAMRNAANGIDRAMQGR